MLCPLGKHVTGTQLSEQKKTRPVNSMSKHKMKKKTQNENKMQNESVVPLLEFSH